MAAAAQWMMANGFQADTVRWLTSLPAGLQTQLPVQTALANSYLADNDWLSLRGFMSKNNWSQMDFLRSAFLSHAWYELGETLVADGEWHAAVGKAGEQFGVLTALLDLAGRWQMDPEREQLLWQIIAKFPREQWAQQELERLCFVVGNTPGLDELYPWLLSFSSPDPGLKNNLAATSLLLRRNFTQAFRLAKEAHEQKPDDPFAASTYAYSLHLQGRTQDGLAIMKTLKSESLNQPSVTLYYGVLLSAA